MQHGDVLYQVRIAGVLFPIRAIEGNKGGFYGEVRAKTQAGEFSKARGAVIDALAEVLPNEVELLSADGETVLGKFPTKSGMTADEQTQREAHDRAVKYAREQGRTEPKLVIKPQRRKVTAESVPFESSLGKDRVFRCQISENTEAGTWYLFQVGVRGQGGGGGGKVYSASDF